MTFQHESILLNECINGLNIKEDGIYVDGTLGGAGHSIEIVKRLSNKGRLIGIDQDDRAIDASTERLKDYKEKVIIVRNNYVEIKHVLDTLGIEKVSGILLDLGVSSHQLDESSRGFSYMHDAPLDMRMDQRQTLTARDIVNTYEHGRLAKVLRDYGEEKFASRIASFILTQREIAPIETTHELVEIIKRAIPRKSAEKGGHPAKRTFQAIRIELNQELTVLKDAINQMIDSLEDEGRLCIISFHSLEDRIVKHMFRTAFLPCTCPPDFPICVCGKVSKGFMINKKPILPSDEEMSLNPRAKSAKLRIFERKVGVADE
ncbi:MAG: 16S rRNA (cytosine(1402)-N(4))-methyltransferase RsmH [Vallitaleaceae bacterium]|jgi:16S rRNA (cytosine1402-N4)-methyltransferase|nr:16S rRNA (cytosine(1402)-N(4))-methyltransferase RsmH [Vallitaleaceae bacterium]